MKLTFALIPVIWWLTFAMPALAQVTPGSECGAAGGGYVPGHDGRPVLQQRTAEQAKGTRVAADGWWTVCEAPAAAPVPVPCPGTGAPREWSVGPHRCTSAMRSATGANDPARDNGIHDGSAAIWRQWTGDMRGHLIERCVSGQRIEIGRTCAPAAACDYAWALVRNGVTYIYNGVARPVQIGGRVDAKASDGRSIGLWCGPGAKFSIVR